MSGKIIFSLTADQASVLLEGQRAGRFPSYRHTKTLRSLEAKGLLAIDHGQRVLPPLGNAAATLADRLAIPLANDDEADASTALPAGDDAFVGTFSAPQVPK